VAFFIVFFAFSGIPRPKYFGSAQGFSGSLVQDNSYLALEPADETGLEAVLGSSITYCIAVGPHQGRKAFSLQTLPCAGSLQETSARVAKVAGFALHAGVAAARHERQKLINTGTVYLIPVVPS
jgi:hypothetical protein